MKDSHQNNIPKHVAIIMDGNGRWAKKIGKKRAFGHENGTSSVKECINASISLGVKNLTNDNDKLNLNLAISYGSRQELLQAIRELSDKVKNNIISVKNIDENIINEHLYTRNLPNVDLLIRTGGESRVSNFLLWQIAYAEMYFTNILWPDFKEKDFLDAIGNYQKRERRFGKISEQKK